MRHPDAQLQCKSSDVCLDVCYRMLCVCVGKYVDKCMYGYGMVLQKHKK